MSDTLATFGPWRLVRLAGRHPAVLHAGHRFDMEAGLTRHPRSAMSLPSTGTAYCWAEDARIVHATLVVRDRLGAWIAWTWTDPARRRRGLLRATWRALRTLVGPLAVTPVASPAMAAFLATLPEAERPPVLDLDVLTVALALSSAGIPPGGTSHPERVPDPITPATTPAQCDRVGSSGTAESVRSREAA